MRGTTQRKHQLVERSTQSSQSLLSSQRLRCTAYCPLSQGPLRLPRLTIRATYVTSRNCRRLRCPFKPVRSSGEIFVSLCMRVKTKALTAELIRQLSSAHATWPYFIPSSNRPSSVRTFLPQSNRLSFRLAAHPYASS